MESSAVPQYTVFISHASEDKATIAMPLREKLIADGITTFVDEADIPPGFETEKAKIAAMETAKIAVVVLSPEFVARKWSMKELFCLLERRENTAGDAKYPVIIPFFYRLRISDIYDEPRLDRTDTNGQSLYHASRFFQRMDAGEPEADIPRIKEALSSVHGIMGVRNDVNASNDTAYEMSVRRDILLNSLCKAVLNALERNNAHPLTNAGRVHPEGETYCAHYLTANDTREFVLTFFNKEEIGYANTPEGSLLQKIVDESPDANKLIAVRGIAGVGKTILVRELSCLDQVKQRFKDGVYHVSLGIEATRRKVIEALSTAVQNAGGRETANAMRMEKDFQMAMDNFRSWFDGRQCFFIVDDVWMTHDLPMSVIDQLLSLHSSGRDSKVLLTTRSIKIASRANTCILLEPRNTGSLESREILTRYAGLELRADDVANEIVVDEILGRCSGLPLFLAIAGKAVKALSFRGGHQGCAAYHAYAKLLRSSVHTLLHEEITSYPHLAARFMISVDLLQQRKNMLGVRFRLTIAELHRRLSVLLKQSPVPMSTLRHLWELETESDAALVAREFEQVGLADSEFKRTISGCNQFLRLHDSMHDFAVEETRKNGEEKIGHEMLLKGYGRDLETQHGYQVWWSPTLEPDGYIHEHLCRHLAEAGRGKDLVELLFCPEWVARTAVIRDVDGVESDFVLGMAILRKWYKKLGNRTSLTTEMSAGSSFRRYIETMESLRLVLQAVNLSCLFLKGNLGQIWFQLHGRLIRYVQRFDMIRKFVDRIEEKAPKPRLLSLNSFLIAPGDDDIRVFNLEVAVHCLTVMKDGEQVACGCEDGRIVIVNLILTAEIENEWNAHDKAVSDISIARDEKRLVSVSFDQTAKVWDMQTNELVATFRLHVERLTCVAMMKDGKRVLSGSADGTAQVWDPETGGVLSLPFRGHNSWVRCVAVFPDGEHVVTGGEDRSLRIWSATSGVQIGEAFVGPEHLVCCVVVSQDGQRIVSGSEDGTLRIWDVASHAQIGEALMGHTSRVNSVDVNVDGSRILSGSNDGTIRVWDVQSGMEVCNPLRAHEVDFTQASFLPVGDAIVSCSLEGLVRSWDLRRRTCERYADEFIHQHDAEVTSVSFTPDGMGVVSGSKDHTLRIWNVRSGKQIGSSLREHSGEVTSVAVSPDGKLVLSASLDNTICIWNMKSRALLHRRPVPSSLLHCVGVTSKGDLTALCSSGRTVYVGDIASSGRRVVLAGHSAAVMKVFLSDDGSSVISVASDGKVLLWDMEMGQIVKQVTKEDSWELSKRQILNLVEEGMLCYQYPDSSLSLVHSSDSFSYVEMTCGGVQAALLLAALDFEVLDWALSPDKSILCVGLETGRVAFMKLET